MANNYEKVVSVTQSWEEAWLKETSSTLSSKEEEKRSTLRTIDAPRSTLTLNKEDSLCSDFFFYPKEDASPCILALTELVQQR